MGVEDGDCEVCRGGIVVQTDEPADRDRVVTVDHSPRNVVVEVEFRQVGELGVGQPFAGNQEAVVPGLGRQARERVGNGPFVVRVYGPDLEGLAPPGLRHGNGEIGCSDHGGPREVKGCLQCLQLQTLYPMSAASSTFSERCHTTIADRKHCANVPAVPQEIAPDTSSDRWERS